MTLLEQYNDLLEAAKLASNNEKIQTSSIVGTILSYSDSLKNAAYLAMIEGNHLLEINNLKDILKVLITSSLIFNIRLKKIKDVKELEFLDNDSFDIDLLFRNVALLSFETYLNVEEEKEGINNDLIIFLIKYYFYYNPAIQEASI